MGRKKSFEDLEAWQIGRSIALRIYELTRDFPKDEAFTVASQIREAATSVPANIADGFGRQHFMDQAKFYLNAKGSLQELKSHLLISIELGFVDDGKCASVLRAIDELSMVLNDLISETKKLNGD